MQKKTEIDDKSVEEIIKCSGEKNCDMDNKNWFFSHQTDLQIY